MAGGNVPANLAPIFQAAGRQFGVPPAVLAGVSSVESDIFRNTSTSSTGAQGGMQFEPGTARSLGVNPNDPHSAIFGAAKLLVQYGYHQNPLRAIGAYNGGPGNPQYGYARQVMSEAQRLAPQLHGSVTGPTNLAPNFSSAPPAPSSPSGPTFDQAGFRQAQDRYLAGSFAKATDASNPFDIPVKGAAKFSDPLLTSGVLSTTAPDPKNYVIAQSTLQAVAGDTPLVVHPAVKQLTPDSHIAGGFLPHGAKYIVGRRDQGRDGQTNPGGPIEAPGAGFIVAIKSDPNGFGPRYPVVHFTTGPYAGRTMYIGHTLAAISHGSFKAGQVLSYTGTHGIGNATVPGWFEIGFADSGNPGPMGQAVPF